MRFPILALLARGRAHGYELKQDFETHFGEVWPPLNVGQVCATLARLERDGFVQATEVAQPDRPNRRVYSLTGSGKEALAIWLDEPAVRPKVRDDFVLKLVLAGLAGIADPAGADREAAPRVLRGAVGPGRACATARREGHACREAGDRRCVAAPRGGPEVARPRRRAAQPRRDVMTTTIETKGLGKYYDAGGSFGFMGGLARARRPQERYAAKSRGALRSTNSTGRGRPKRNPWTPWMSP